MAKVKGSATTPKGTLPPQMLKRFGLTQNAPGNYESDLSRSSQETRRWVKRMTQDMVTLRMLKQCKTETQLPLTVKSAIKYFSHPFGGEKGERVRYNSGSSEGADPTKVPLKV